jgi:predicted metalloprotease
MGDNFITLLSVFKDTRLNAAAQIGDDRIQKRTQGYVIPEGFTHGSAGRRVRWFRRGLESGDLRQCDTFTEGQVSPFFCRRLAI